MQAIKKKILSNIFQKLPILEIIKPTAETINNIQLKIFILLLFIFLKSTIIFKEL